MQFRMTMVARRGTKQTLLVSTVTARWLLLKQLTKAIFCGTVVSKEGTQTIRVNQILRHTLRIKAFKLFYNAVFGNVLSALFLFSDAGRISMLEAAGLVC